MTTVIFAPGKLDFVFVIFVSGHIQLRMKHFKMLLKSSVALSCGRASLGNALLFVLLSSSFFFFFFYFKHTQGLNGIPRTAPSVLEVTGVSHLPFLF